MKSSLKDFLLNNGYILWLKTPALVEKLSASDLVPLGKQHATLLEKMLGTPALRHKIYSNEDALSGAANNAEVAQEILENEGLRRRLFKDGWLPYDLYDNNPIFVWEMLQKPDVVVRCDRKLLGQLVVYSANFHALRDKASLQKKLKKEEWAKLKKSSAIYVSLTAFAKRLAQPEEGADLHSISAPPTKRYSRFLCMLAGFFMVSFSMGASFLVSIVLALEGAFLLKYFSEKYAEYIEEAYDTKEQINALSPNELEALRVGYEASQGYRPYLESFVRPCTYRHYGAFLKGYIENDEIFRQNIRPR